MTNFTETPELRQERVAFEDCYRNITGYELNRFCDYEGHTSTDYVVRSTQVAWQIWLASAKWRQVNP